MELFVTLLSSFKSSSAINPIRSVICIYSPTL
jgi:hypothetical protein